MVRFHWHVEQGYSAYIPPDGVSTSKDAKVQHATCEIEIPGQKETLPAVLTLPRDHLKLDKVKELGIVIGHGGNAVDWDSKFLAELAAALAVEGYLVMRYCCKQKELRRQKMYEKALDAAATSPYARGITRWLLAAMLAGLQEPEPMPPGKGRRSLDSTPGPSNSEGPLLGLQPPVLLVAGDSDELCNLPHLQKVCTSMKSSDIRMVVIKDADSALKAPQARTHSPAAMKDISSAVLDFAEAICNGALDSCSLPKPSAPEAVQALQAEQLTAAGPSQASQQQFAQQQPTQQQHPQQQPTQLQPAQQQQQPVRQLPTQQQHAQQQQQPAEQQSSQLQHAQQHYSVAGLPFAHQAHQHALPTELPQDNHTRYHEHSMP